LNEEPFAGMYFRQLGDVGNIKNKRQGVESGQSAYRSCLY